MFCSDADMNLVLLREARSAIERMERFDQLKGRPAARFHRRGMPEMLWHSASSVV